jgi:glycosyltransferase involved in cell wall biosynthesis
MRILLVHHFYDSSSVSGENRAVLLERDLLARHGHEVHLLSRHSDQLRGRPAHRLLSTALGVPWNLHGAALMRRAVREHAPDLVHVHNTFPLLSPAVFAAARGIPRVLTLHNYRLFCANTFLHRNGGVCTDCLDRRSSGPALRHACYRSSHLATLPVAAGIALHRRLGTWQREVDGFIALSEFQKRLLVDAGLPEARIDVKPNFFPDGQAVLPWGVREPFVVFAGRVSVEKGVLGLVRAWRLWGPSAPLLRIIGDGPQRRQAQALAAGLNIEFLGQRPASEVHACMARAQLVVVPSEWFEGCPLVIQEALAMGTPVAVSAVGGLPELVGVPDSGVTFDVADPASMASVLRRLWATPGLLRQLARAARRRFEQTYGEHANHQRLMAIYRDVQARSSAVSPPRRRRARGVS